MPISLKLAGDGQKAVQPPPIPQQEKAPFSVEAELTSGTETIGQGRKILVVDDNPIVLQAFELKLTYCGFTVVTTTKPGEVTSMVEQAGPELIILDVHFPPVVGQDWDGFMIVQWLRRFPEMARIPVILISGEDPGNYKEKAVAEGAVAFFQKPVAFSEVLATIVRALDIQQ